MSKNIVLSGTVKEVQDTVEVGSNNFKKRAIAIEEQDGEYTNLYAVDFLGDKVDKLDGILEGSDVEISINIRCNKSEGRYFTQLTGWKIEVK